MGASRIGRRSPKRLQKAAARARAMGSLMVRLAFLGTAMGADYARCIAAARGAGRPDAAHRRG
jgi:hypothetical protein